MTSFLSSAQPQSRSSLGNASIGHRPDVIIEHMPAVRQLSYNRTVMARGEESRWRIATKPQLGYSFMGKCLGVPCVVVLFFIVFVLYSPDTYRRSITALPLASNRAATNRLDEMDPLTTSAGENLMETADVISVLKRAFPVELVKWIRHCNKISPLIAMEPKALECLDQTSSKSCLSKSLSRTYRFAIMPEGSVNIGLLLAKMAFDSVALGWNATRISLSAKAMVLNREKLTVLVSVLEFRPKYWYVHWTRSDDSVNEPPRAFLGLNLTAVEIGGSSNKLLIPTPLDFYLWQWPKSVFLECNHTSAAYLRRAYPKYYAAPSKIDDSFLDVLAYCRDLMLKHRITPMLAGGTGLGWYRECGVIPDTTDTDLMFPASEWKLAFEEDLKRDSVLKLYWILGKPNDSLELSVYSRRIKIDMFALYEESNRSWVGGMIVGERVKLKWWYPKFERSCTADLKGHLFYVRCDIIPFLSADYGPRWYEPHHNANFVWYKSHKNIQRAGAWDISEWPQVYRTFRGFF